MIDIVQFAETYADQVRQLFVRVNRLLAPPSLKEAFEAYIAASLEAEIDRITAYYTERNGGFWLAVENCKVVGMFGLEPLSPGVMELRRMYVDPDVRRQGIARQLLRHAEDECRRQSCHQLSLSTSELQSDALAFYRAAGYRLEREEVTEAASHKTLGRGLRRFHFYKPL